MNEYEFGQKFVDKSGQIFEYKTSLTRGSYFNCHTQYKFESDDVVLWLRDSEARDTLTPTK